MKTVTTNNKFKNTHTQYIYFVSFVTPSFSFMACQVSQNSFESNSQHDIYLYIGSEQDELTVEGNTGVNIRNTFE